MKTICILIPYFGQWPEWIDLYFTSCAYNSSIQWVFITDCEPRSSAPKNVRFEMMTWQNCVRLLREKCGVLRGPATPHKLCDYKMAFGHVFENYIAGYDFWGFGDIDLIYGDLRSFLTPEVLSHDLITFNRTHLSGHFTLIRNLEQFYKNYQQLEIWQRGADVPNTLLLDENIGYYGIENVYSIESYNTPLSPYIPWTNGEFFFPQFWYYINGKLYNNLNGDRHFMYLHFMRYKYLWTAGGLSNIVHFQNQSKVDKWMLSLDGFWPYMPDDRVNKNGSGIWIKSAIEL